MKREIKSREDVEYLVHSFYDRVFKDDLLAPIFLGVAKVDPEVHFPILIDFWESILLGNPSYKGNPMSTHLLLNQKAKLTEAHFQRWLKLFNETIDELFEGVKATEAKERANSIAAIMQHKINS